MKDGYVITKSAGVTADELDKINAYSRRPLTADEVYTFSLVLCDNEIDRDNERFSIDALYKLSKLFCGKSGIFDHNMRAGSQTARIYSCEVVSDNSRKTKAGEAYHKLLAKAYMPRLASNSDLITEIESGIKKEVSVGCAVDKTTCSVCGHDMRSADCIHVKGREYSTSSGKVKAHAVLDNPTDAYEWSFVAVPAQVGAGVCKAYSTAGDNGSTDNCRTVNELIKSMKSSELSDGIILSRDEAKLLSKYVDGLISDANDGVAYRKSLADEVQRLYKKSDSTFPSEVLSKVMARMTGGELHSLKCSLEAAAKRRPAPDRPQLGVAPKQTDNTGNKKFMI